MNVQIIVGLFFLFSFSVADSMSPQEILRFRLFTDNVLPLVPGELGTDISENLFKFLGKNPLLRKQWAVYVNECFGGNHVAAFNFIRFYSNKNIPCLISRL